MTLLLIADKLWRYKLLTLPIIMLVLAAGFYVVALTPPVYQASTSYILVSPPAPPTADQIAQNPKLAHGASNPYTRYSDQSIIVQILATRIGSDATRASLLKQGADPRYLVAPDVAFGFTAPVVQITGLAASPAAAMKTASVVGAALTDELSRMQSQQNVVPTYQISAQQIVGVGQAEMKASGKLRGLVAVMALGTVLLFLAVSVLDAFAVLRHRRSHPATDEGTGLKLAGRTPGPDSAYRAPPEHPLGPSPPERVRASASAWDGPQPPQPTTMHGRPTRSSVPPRALGHGHSSRDD